MLRVTSNLVDVLCFQFATITKRKTYFKAFQLQQQLLQDSKITFWP